MKDGKFSGVDVVITVVLIALLVLFFIPIRVSTSGPRGRAPRTKCKNNLKQMGIALAMYAMENNEKLPAASGVVVGDASSNTRELAMESLLMLYPKYISDPALFICPQANSSYPYAGGSAAVFGDDHCDYGYDPTHTLSHRAGVVLIADRAGATSKDNSPNHLGEGQHTLNLGNAVDWNTTTNCGYLKDEIYSADRPAAMTDDTGNSNIK